jgi:hypothetical protein
MDNTGLNGTINATLVLPNNALLLVDQEFFEMVKSFGGQTLCEILQCQSINSTEVFLKSVDVFEIFNYNIPSLYKIKEKACFITKNGDIVVKTGVKNSLNYLTTILKRKQEEILIGDSQEEVSNDLIASNPLLKSLVKWYSHKEHTNNQSSNLFLSKFIDTLTSNIATSNNCQRYDDLVKEFGLSLYILGGKKTYEFVRLNLGINALPSLTTINKLISNTGVIKEAEFRFDQLQQYLQSVDVKFGFVSEDCTSVIRKIKYNVSSNSFTGFATPLIKGIPVANHYRTDSFEQLKTWFDSIDKSPLLNVHMFQPIPSLNQKTVPGSFLLAGYGVVNTFTAMDVLHRWAFIFDRCMENNIRIIGFSTGKDVLVLDQS